MPSNAVDAEVFVYTGPRGDDVPQDVVRVRVDPSVTSIPARAFYQRNKLTEVELCEGVVEIGDGAFMYCSHSITKIDIPTSLRRINNYAFEGSLRCHIRLHDGIESIGQWAFARCIFTNFRSPPFITVILNGMLLNCRSMFSLELPDNVTEIGNYAFINCFCLRNVALPPNAVFGDEIFIDEDVDDNEMELHTDLYQLFGSESRIIFALQHRFNGLPIHSIVYYQSYHEGVLQILIAAINMRLSQRQTLITTPKLDPTGNLQDCLGMTPLHILACSSVHNLDIYRLIVENYPTNLTAKDRWGAVPLLYAIWGDAPAEIIQFLLESYRSLYPGHVFNWTMMVETMGRCDTPKDRIENLLHVKQMHCPEQPIDWENLLDKFAELSIYSLSGVPFCERMRFLFICGMSDHVEALEFRLWRNHIKNMIHTADFEWDEDNRSILRSIRNKLAHFEVELTKLKEVTTILELALWKMKITENGHQDMATHDSNVHSQDRITCGADVVIGHLLTFLINTE
jgi:hypothetical protein